MNLDREFAARFTCPKCGSSGARVKRIATSGTGLSRLFDLQHNKFLAASCERCGFTELYSLAVLEGTRPGMDVLDLLFGG